MQLSSLLSHETSHSLCTGASPPCLYCFISQLASDAQTVKCMGIHLLWGHKTPVHPIWFFGIKSDLSYLWMFHMQFWRWALHSIKSWGFFLCCAVLWITCLDFLPLFCTCFLLCPTDLWPHWLLLFSTHGNPRPSLHPSLAAQSKFLSNPFVNFLPTFPRAWPSFSIALQSSR